MSIVSEVNRLKDAKTAIKTAIEGKGVTVPDATMLDGMAALIDGIEAGGVSLEYNRLKIAAKGTFTVAEKITINNDNRYIFEHNAGVTPLLFVLRANNTTGTNDLYVLATFRTPNYYVNTTSNCTTISSRRATSSYYYSDYQSETGNISAKEWNEQYVSIVAYNTTIYLNTNITYNWTAFYVE